MRPIHPLLTCDVTGARFIALSTKYTPDGLPVPEVWEGTPTHPTGGWRPAPFTPNPHDVAAFEAKLRATVDLYDALGRLWQDPANGLRGQIAHMGGDINAVARQWKEALHGPDTRP